MTDYDPNFNPQNYQMQQFQTNNQGFNSASALQIRLNPEHIIEEFQVYLRGKEFRTVMDRNKPVVVAVECGEPIVNDTGYQAVMRWLNLVLNNQVIQGNFLDEKYFGEYMMNLRKDVVLDLMVNRIKYGIDIRNFQGLVSGFMNCSYLILTRPIGNKEREGMNNTVKVQETMNSQQQGRGMFNVPFFGGGKK